MLIAIYIPSEEPVFAPRPQVIGALGAISGGKAPILYHPGGGES